MIYVYECENCDHSWEEMRKVDERDLQATCPECEQEGTRVQSASNFKINGFSEANRYGGTVGDMMPKQMRGKRFQ
jgi:putative FmdB family regulatory protein